MENGKRLKILQERPYNACPPLDELCRAEITLISPFYVRNRGPVPAVDARSYRITVSAAAPETAGPFDIAAAPRKLLQ